MAVVDELELHEVRCSECGKPVSSIPLWLADAKVNFQCEECRQKHPRVGVNLSKYAVSSTIRLRLLWWTSSPKESP